MISLFFFMISILLLQVFSQLENFEARFENTDMGIDTKLQFAFNANKGALGRNMTFLLDYDLELWPNLMHACYFYQNVSFMMSCRSYNRDEDHKWEMTVRGDYGDIPFFDFVNFTLMDVPTPEREGYMKSILYYTYNGVPMTHAFTLYVKGKTDSPLVTYILSHSNKRENTLIHYVIESKYTVRYSLDIQLDYPMYSFDDQPVSVIDFFNHNKEPSFAPVLDNPGGLGDDSHLEVNDNQRSIKIIRAFPHGVVENQKYYFTITNLVCPEVMNKRQFDIKLIDEYNNVPNMNYYTVSAGKPGVLSLLDFAINSTIINSYFSFNITLKTDGYKTRNASLEILIPKTFNRDFIEIICINNCQPNFRSYQISNEYHYLNPEGVSGVMGVGFIEESQAKEVTNSFSIEGMIMPRSAKPIIINITITSMDGDVMYMLPNGYKLNPTAMNITDFNITQSNKNIFAQGSMTFSLLNPEPLIKGDKIQVLFCKNIAVSNAPAEECASSYLTTGILPTSKCQVENNVLTVTDITEGTILRDTLITFKVMNVQNPGMVMECPMNITIRTEDNFVMHTNLEIKNAIFTPGSYNYISATADDLMNSAVTNYRFEIEISHTIEPSGGFEFIFPKEITLESALTCDGSFTCHIDGQNVKAITNIEIQGLTNVSLTLHGVKNPRSFKTSENVYVNSISSQGYVIDAGWRWITNEVPLLFDWNVELRSKNAYNASGYIFTINLEEDIIEKDYLIIEVPNDIEIIRQTTPPKAIGSNKLSNNLKISTGSHDDYAGKLMYIPVYFSSNEIKSIPKGETIMFEVIGLQNANCTRPFTSFNIYIKDSNKYSIMNNNKPITLTMEPMELLTYAVYPLMQEVNIVSNYVIYFKPYIPLKTSDKVILVYPEEITEVSDQCVQTDTSEVPSIIVEHDLSKRQLTFTLTLKQIEFSGLIKFECKNWKSVLNERQQKTSSFQLYTTAGDGYKKEKALNNLLASFDCFYPCEECVEGSKTQCSKCLSTSIYSILQGETCLTECPFNYSYDPETKTCVKCVSSCLECELWDTSKCKSCSESFPYYIKENMQCLENCPISKYANEASVCLDCSSDCRTCETRANKCTSCNINGNYQFLYNNQCYEKCPGNTITQSSYKCIDCSPSCKTCQDKPTYCTSCEESLLLNKQCVQASECIAEMNYYPDHSIGVCLRCQEGCEICGDKVTECKQCKDTHFQIGSNCYKKVDFCLSGYYLTSDKICEKCDDSCLRCENSPTKCLTCHDQEYLQESSCVEICSDDYLIFNNTCVLTCPEKYIKKQNQCINESENNSPHIKSEYKISDDYFLLLAFSLLFLLSVGIIKIFFKETLYFGCVIALMSIASFFTSILLFSYAFMSNEMNFFYPICVVFILQKVISYGFLLLYIFYLGNDKLLIHWKKSHPISNFILISTMVIIDYKIFRLFHSKLFNLDLLHVQRKSYQTVKNIYSKVSIAEVILIHLSSIIICIIIIASYKPYSFLYYLSIEYTIIIVILSVAIIIDLFLCHNWDLLLAMTQKKEVQKAALPKLKLNGKQIKEVDINETNIEGNGDINKSNNISKDRKDHSSRVLCTNNKDTLRTIDGLMISNTNDEEEDKNKNLEDNIRKDNKYLYTMIENQVTDRDFAINVEPLKRKSIQNNKELYSISSINELSHQDERSNEKEKEKDKNRINNKNIDNFKENKRGNIKKHNGNISDVNIDDINFYEQTKQIGQFEEMDDSIINNNISHS